MSSSHRRWQQAQHAEEEHQRGKRAKPEGIEDFLNTFPTVDASFFRGKVCVEIGCGITGPIHYLPNTRESIGIDPLYDKLKELYLEEKTENVKHINGVGEDLPLESDSVDVVIIYGVLDHCQNPGQVVYEAGRVLKKGGSLFLSLYTFSRVPGVIRRHLLGLVDRPHPYHFSRREVLKLASDAQFELMWTSSEGVKLNKAIYVWKTTSLRSSIKTAAASVIGMEDSNFIFSK